MPGMYEVYTQQRPGRPRWALGSSAILLLLTVGLAAALAHHKAGLGGVTMKPFTGPFLRGKLPADWTEIQDDLPTGTALAFAEPARADQPGRRLFIFARPAFPFPAPPASYAKVAAELYAKEVLSWGAASSGEMKDEAPPAGLSEQIGRLPAVSVVIRLSPPQNAPAWICVARAAILPGGQVLGVALLTRGDLESADIRLLDRVSRELDFQIPGLRPSAAPGEDDEAPGVEAATVALSRMILQVDALA